MTCAVPVEPSRALTDRPPPSDSVPPLTYALIALVIVLVSLAPPPLSERPLEAVIDVAAELALTVSVSDADSDSAPVVVVTVEDETYASTSLAIVLLARL
jgi:hypothetical protein